MGAESTPLARALLAIFWGGLACGILDITQAMVGLGLLGIKPTRALQGVASGLLGPKSFQGGVESAVLGAALHFFIAFTAAAVFYVASRKIGFLTQQWFISGLLYGEIVFLVMNFIVIPLSAIHRFPNFTPFLIITGPIGHPFLVGLPIAFAVRKFAA